MSGCARMRRIGRDLFLASTMLVIANGAAHAASSTPSVDTLKQVLDKRLQSLRPDGKTERNVLFEDVRAGKPNGNSYPFQVTLTLRDYGPGYPPNRYYGDTCVGRMEKAPFTLSRDAYDEWQVQGAMTIGMQCKANPAAGVSSIPVTTLAGTPAPAAKAGEPSPGAANGNAPPVRVAQSSASGKGPALGSYECWFFSQARMGLNFKLQGNGRYTDSEGKAGAYTFDAKSGAIRFKGGVLDGQAPIYHEPNGHPTASFRNNKGDEISFCELAK